MTRTVCSGTDCQGCPGEEKKPSWEDSAGGDESKTASLGLATQDQKVHEGFLSGSEIQWKQLDWDYDHIEQIRTSF